MLSYIPWSELEVNNDVLHSLVCTRGKQCCLTSFSLYVILQSIRLRTVLEKCELAHVSAPKVSPFLLYLAYGVMTILQIVHSNIRSNTNL